MKEPTVALTIREGEIPPPPPCQHVLCGDSATSIINMVAYDSAWELWSCQAHAEDFKIQIAGQGTDA